MRSRVNICFVVALVAACLVPTFLSARPVPVPPIIQPDFGLINVGQSSTTQSLSFNFSSTVQVGRVAVLTLGASGKDFQAVGGTCAPGTYSSGDSCTVEIAFGPLAPGTRRGAVVLYDTATPPNVLVTRYLSGVGAAPMVGFTPGIISTVPNSGTNNDGDANAIAIDGAGNLYIAETSSHIIRKLTPAGVATVVAGGGTGCAGQSDDHGDGCPATQAQLDSPAGVALDGAGNIYIADSYFPSIRKVDASTGIISMVVGIGLSGSTGDGGPATSARINNPYVVIVDGAGNLYLPDIRRVRKVDAATGIIDTIAGTMTQGDSGDGGPATSATFRQPMGLTFDIAGNLYIADYASHRVRKVDATTGIITTVAGTGNQGYSGDGGPATSARFAYPWGVAVDPAGNLYIADRNNYRVRKVDTNGTITTIAGNRDGCSEQKTSYGDGCVATHAWLWDPIQLVLDDKGNLYVADYFGNMVRKLNVSDPPSLTFPSTNVGSVSSAQDVTIQDIGNAELNVTQIAISSNFVLQGVNTSCSTSGQLLSAGAECVLGIEFAPQSGGATSGTAVLTDNALNVSNATQAITLNGTGTGVADATTVTTLMSSPNPSSHGSSVTFTATVLSVSGTPAGSVTFSNGATTLGTGTLDSSGQAVLVTSALAVGTHMITAAYDGATGFLASSSPAVTQTVTSGIASTTISVTSSGSPATYGGSVTFTATITSASGVPTGAVTFMDGAATLGVANLNGSGVATFTAHTMGIGGHSIIAAYGGDTSYGSSTSAVLSHIVNPAVLTVTADAKSMTYGGALPALTWSYSGYVGSDTAAVVTGVPACTTTATTTSNAGTYPITCAAGTLAATNYTFNSFVPGTLTITTATSNTVLTSSKAIVHSPATATLTATVTSNAGTPAGVVNFFSGTTSVGSANLDNTGKATLNLASSAVNGNKHNLTAAYAGSTNIGGSTSSVLTQYMFAGAPDFRLAASISQVTLRRGQQASLSITFTPLNGYDGTITFACPGLPAGVFCTFTPPQMVGNLENTPMTGTLLISTNGPAQVASNTRPLPSSRWGALLAVWSMGLGSVGMLLAGSRRHTRKSRSRLWLIGFGLVLLLMLAGCGFHPADSVSSNWTPTGTTMATVTATATATSSGTAAANPSQQLQIQITVTP